MTSEAKFDSNNKQLNPDVSREGQKLKRASINLRTRRLRVRCRVNSRGARRTKRRREDRVVLVIQRHNSSTTADVRVSRYSSLGPRHDFKFLVILLLTAAKFSFAFDRKQY